MPRLAFKPEYDEWEPPTELLELIANKELLQRDRVELIIAFYAADHGGNTPTYEKIGQVLKISTGNAYNYAMELCRPWECRAIRKNGKFWLIDSQFSHPVLKEKRFAGVKYPS